MFEFTRLMETFKGFKPQKYANNLFFSLSRVRLSTRPERASSQLMEHFW